MDSFPRAGDWDVPGPVVYVYGNDLARGVMLARGWASAVGARLLLVDVGAWRLTQGGPLGWDTLVAVTREALLQHATLVLSGVEPVVERGFDGLQMGHLRTALEEYPGLAFLIGHARWEAAICWTKRLSLSLTPGACRPRPARTSGLRIWTTAFPPRRLTSSARGTTSSRKSACLPWRRARLAEQRSAEVNGSSSAT